MQKNEKKFAFTPNNWEKYDKIQLEGAKNFSVSLIINPKTSFYL